jgi:hypothetical protein
VHGWTTNQYTSIENEILEVSLTSPSTIPLKPELFQLAVAAIRDGLAEMRDVMRRNSHLYIPRQSDWYEVKIGENGMPSFSKNERAAPLAYSYLFGSASSSDIDENAIISFQALIDYLVADREYRDTRRYGFRPDISEEQLLYLARVYASVIPAKLVEQYQIVYPDEEFAEQVPIDVVIPMLMVQAAFDEHRLGPSILIRRMDERFQQARAALLDFAYHIHKWASEAATHAIVIEGRTLSRAQRHGLTGFPWELDDPAIYPISVVDEALAVIRIATGFQTGYAQALIHYRYAHSEHEDKFLPILHGIPVRRYPVSFDHWGSVRPIPMITAADAQLAADLFRLLNQMPESSTMAIAARCVNDCYLRDRQDDAILDAVIAFETLLSDDDHQELTYKLALRVAALLKLEQDLPKSPAEAFREIKRIYNYRSKLVHGKAKDAEKIVQKYFAGDANGPLVAALNYLRLVMRLLLQNERYRKPAAIDRYLLIGGHETKGASED